MFDWLEFLDLARELAQPVRNEASLRTAISRAYYSAYHRTTMVCRERTALTPRQHRLWKQIEEYGRLHNRLDLVEIGMLGADLHWYRIQADYHNPYNVSNRKLKPLPVLAYDIIGQTEQLLALIEEV